MVSVNSAVFEGEKPVPMIFQHVMNKRGNVAILWVASLPIFALLFAFIGTLVTIWMTHSSSQMAADAASLAATQKMDAWVRQAMSEELSRADGIALSTDAQKRDFMLRVISGHERGLQNVVREYVQKHGGDKHGEIHIGKNGRIEVNARYNGPKILDTKKGDVKVGI